MDSSFLHRVTHIVTFCRNELFLSGYKATCFSVRYSKFLEENIL